MTPAYRVFYYDDKEKIVVSVGLCCSVAITLSESLTKKWETEVSYEIE